jgi:uncharacterized damage-inducible protein DinB
MFNRLDEFFETYQHFTAGTLKLLDALDDACLTCPVTTGHRTLGQIAWHITTSIPEMMGRTGLSFGGFRAGARPPVNAKEIAAAYRQASTELVQTMKDHWSDATLKETDDMYGDRWPRGLTLRILLDHEMHHRGQMTVLMRQAGLKVPGIFGPAQEEWAAMGMKAPEF